MAASNPTRLRVFYTAVEGTSSARHIVPEGVIWHKRRDLPRYEWFLRAFDVDACSECLLRLAGCDFSQGDVLDRGHL